MAYRKKRNNNGGFRRKRKQKRYRNYNSNFTYGQVLDKVTSDVARLKGLINVEFKSVDTINDLTVTSTNSIVLINALVVGDDFSNRDGRKVRFKSVEITLNIVQNATPINTFMRIMVVIDKQPNEILLVITDLLTANTMDSHRNLDHRKRFVILRDEVISLSDAERTNMTWNYYKQLDMITIYDNSNTGDITDITTNAIYLIMTSSEASNGPAVNQAVRMRFIDN